MPCTASIFAFAATGKPCVFNFNDRGVKYRFSGLEYFTNLGPILKIYGELTLPPMRLQ